MENDKENSESFSDRVGVSSIRANDDVIASSQPVPGRKWFDPVNYRTAAVLWPVLFVFYLLKLDKIKWQVNVEPLFRISGNPGKVKEVPGALLVLCLLFIVLLYLLVRYFI